MTIFKTVLVAWPLVIALGGCGGDSKNSSGTCAAITPCGGNLVGTWQVKDTCLAGMLTIDGCPTAKTTFDNVKASGTMTFNADLTGSASITLTGGVTVGLPASCTAGVSCAAVEATFKAKLAQDPTAPFSSVACTGTDPCSCAFVLKGAPMNDNDGYTTSGSVLTQSGSQSDYCVAGDELKMQPHLAITNMTMGTMSMADVKANMTLTRK
jgi:hypothetical protein